METKDELAAARQKRKNKIRVKRAGKLLRVGALIAVVLLCASAVTMATFKDFTDLFVTMFSVGSYPVTLSSDSPEQVDKLAWGYCVQAGDEVSVIKNNGAVLQRINPPYSDVATACGGNKIVVYHRGGVELSFYNRTKLIYSLETAESIIACAVGNRRMVAALCESERYSGEVVVYNTNAEKVMTWYCASGFPYYVTFDNDASHIAVASAYIENGVVCSKVTIIDVSSRKEVGTVQLSCAVIKLLLRNTAFTAVGSSSVSAVNASGEVTARYEYGDRNLLCYTADYRDNIALTFGDNNMADINEVVWLDGELAVRCELNIGIAIKDMSVVRGQLYLLSSNAAVVYTVTGSVAKVFDIHYNAVAMVVADRVIEIMPDTAVVAETGG